MQALSRVEEQSIVEQAQKDAHKVCAPQIKAFAECSQNRTFSMAWACKTQFNDWTQCMKEYLTDERLDAMKKDFIENRPERSAALVEKLKQERLESYKRHAGIKDPAPPPPSQSEQRPS